MAFEFHGSFPLQHVRMWDDIKQRKQAFTFTQLQTGKNDGSVMNTHRKQTSSEQGLVMDYGL